MALAFEWDSRKATANKKKHRVDFLEASTVFGDPLGWFQADDTHTVEEERFRLLGRSSENRLPAVLFTNRGDELVRIISARLATTRERRKYEEDFR